MTGSHLVDNPIIDMHDSVYTIDAAMTMQFSMISLFLEVICVRVLPCTALEILEPIRLLRTHTILP